jgi:hypothetical protein
LPRNDSKGKRRKANGKEENGIYFLWIPAQLLRGNDKKVEKRIYFFMDCHENTPYFLAMTATAKATATTKTTAKATANELKTIRGVVTANPLGCGSLWKIKNNNGNGSGLPRQQVASQ